MFVPKFEILDAVVSEKSLHKIPYALHWSERWKKKEKGKKKSKEISALCFSFTQHTSTLCRCIQNLKTLTLLGAEKSVTKHFIGENEKMTKGIISMMMQFLRNL